MIEHNITDLLGQIFYLKEDKEGLRKELEEMRDQKKRLRKRIRILEGSKRDWTGTKELEVVNLTGMRPHELRSLATYIEGGRQ